MSGRAGSARDAARASSATLPAEPAAVLPAIDFASEDGYARLERLRREAHPRHRQLIETAMAYSEALRGKSPSSRPDGADGAIASELARLVRGEPGAAEPVAQGLAPNFALFDQVTQLRARAAWASGDAAAIPPTFSSVLLLHPRHSQAVQLRAIAIALAPETSNELIPRALDHLSGSERATVVRQLALLSPSRAALFALQVPEDQRTGEEHQRVLLAGGGELPALVDRAVARPSDPVIAAIASRCLAEGQPALARKLLEKATPALQGDLTLAIAIAEGDVAGVAAAGGDAKLAVSTPLARPGQIALHIATVSGLLPRTGLEVRIDGKTVPSDRIARWGSLWLLDGPGNGTHTVDVLVGGQPAWGGRVTL
ncbi:MAG: hypothetical protein H0W72_11880 [Planctomycetes bacterium]|nr:hypothetical protein [Planctomycetota bacterium]